MPGAFDETKTWRSGRGLGIAASNSRRSRGHLRHSSSGDPQARPERHVFVSSKAPWHDIADALPRFKIIPASSRPTMSRRDELSPRYRCPAPTAFKKSTKT